MYSISLSYLKHIILPHRIYSYSVYSPWGATGAGSTGFPILNFPSQTSRRTMHCGSCILPIIAVAFFTAALVLSNKSSLRDLPRIFNGLNQEVGVLASYRDKRWMSGRRYLKRNSTFSPGNPTFGTTRTPFWASKGQHSIAATETGIQKNISPFHRISSQFPIHLGQWNSQTDILPVISTGNR